MAPYIHVFLLVFDFFFFQAEDGIRDLTVTGVQTCALPISAGDVMGEGKVPTIHASAVLVGARAALIRGPASAGKSRLVLALLEAAQAGMRSEERRVGKECRSRWSPYH